MTPRRCAPAVIVTAVLALVGCGSDGDDGASATTTTTGAPAPTTASPTSTTWQRPACPDVSLDRAGDARVADPSLDEISGAAASTWDPTVLWVIEDSGNPAVITALSPSGASLTSLSVTVSNTDWEDMAMVPGTDGGTIVVGDIGDNDAVRASISLVRVAEPDPTGPATSVDGEVVTLRLPSPANTEALLVDPLTGDVVLVTKSIDGVASVVVAQAAADAAPGATIDMLDAGTIELGLLAAVLAGDVAPDGSAIALRTPSRVLWWPRDPSRSVTDTLLGSEPCRLPSPVDPLGEALALRTPDCYVATGEGTNPRLVRGGPDEGC